jgi:hypothetical protein
MRFFLRCMAIILLYLMTPGSSELTENVLHFVTEGHSAHAINDQHHQPQEPEHGCSGPYHFCHCHAPSSFLPLIGFYLLPVQLIEIDHEQKEYDPPYTPSGTLRDIFRPPIA